MKTIDELKDDFFNGLKDHIKSGNFKVRRFITDKDYDIEFGNFNLRMYFTKDGLVIKMPDFLTYKMSSEEVLDQIKKKMKEDEVNTLKIQLQRIEQRYQKEVDGIINRLRYLEGTTCVN